MRLRFLSIELLAGGDAGMEWTTVCGRRYEIGAFDASGFLSGG